MSRDMSTGMKAIVLLLTVLVALFVVLELREPPTIDATMTINTDSKRIRLIDDQDREVGSLEFDEQVTVTIKRHR